MPRLFLHFSLTAAQQRDLNHLLEAQQNRRSPEYHKFLTPEEYAARFGVNSADIDKVTRWLEEQGFRDLRVARSQTFVSFSGTVARAEAAFHLSMHRYSLHGEMHLANATDPFLPKALQGVVLGVRGLHDFRMHRHLHQTHPRYTAASGQNFMVPDDWATIYNVQPLYSAGLDGTGVTIAVVGQSSVQISDISRFRLLSGLLAALPTVVVPPGDQSPGTVSGDETESDLDLEWSGGIAKNANILFVTSGEGVESSITYAIDNNVASILSTSYGKCEADQTTSDFSTLNGLFQQANAQGMTVIAAAGDAGATDCDGRLTETTATKGLAVDFPASSQFVTGVGGTSFSNNLYGWSSTNNANNGSALSYLPEIVWNEGFSEAGSQAQAGGGGASTLVAKPTWQTGVGVPNDGQRDVPDIALAASPYIDGYLICSDGGCVNGFLSATSYLDVAGGTSAGAPTFAGALALVIQEKGATMRLGNINPNLYSIAAIYSNVFHDINSGNNEMPCQTGTPDCPNGGPIGFSATNGYDQASGWGSIDAFNFTAQWYGDFQLSAGPSTITLQPGTSTTATVTVSPQDNFSGNVSFTCSVPSYLLGVTCSVPSTPVSGSGTTTVTIIADINARTIPSFKRIPPPPPSYFLTFTLGAVVLLSLSWRNKRALFVAIAICEMGCGGGGGSGVTTTLSPSAPALTPSCTLPSATMGVAYSGTCSAAGGTSPFAYSISSGALPSGLTINSSTGAITGTPLAEGAASFIVKVTDSGAPAQSATQPEAAFVVGPAALSISCTLPPGGIVSLPYSGQCSSVGGTSPVTFSISNGELPPGLSLNSSTGALTGVAAPTYPASGVYNFDVVATDSASPAMTASVRERIGIEAYSPLEITYQGSRFANVGTFFTAQAYPNFGILPYTLSISAGSLPPGLSLSTTTSPYSLVISGVPTAQGTSSFTVQVTDSESPPQTATQTISGFVVGPALPQTGPVTITATSGNITNTTAITVTVP